MAIGNKVKGGRTNYKLIRDISESYFTLVNHKRNRKGVSVQMSKDYKTLILMLLS
jgi:hypothetical protein